VTKDRLFYLFEGARLTLLDVYEDCISNPFLVWLNVNGYALAAHL